MKTPLPALPKSATATHPKSSYGISVLGDATWCEQHFVNTHKSPIREPLTLRSILGKEVHWAEAQSYQQKPDEGYEKTSSIVPWSTPEEEAAHLFTYTMRTIRLLFEVGSLTEFSVFGNYFDRAFIGNVDRVEVEAAKDGKSKIIKVHEFKTRSAETLKQLGELGLKPFAEHRAFIQASFYVFFLKRMFEIDGAFDFKAYFHARGLDPHRTFSAAFALEFMKKQNMLFALSNSIPPANLKELGEQYAQYIKSLGPIKMSEYFWITSVPTPRRLSSVLGFGSRNTEPRTMAVKYDEAYALEQGRLAVNLLDGHQAPTGVSSWNKRRCDDCRFNTGCSWSWTRRPPSPSSSNRMEVEHSTVSTQIGSFTPPIPNASRSLSQITPTPPQTSHASQASSVINPAPSLSQSDSNSRPYQGMLDLLNLLRFQAPESNSTPANSALIDHSPRSSDVNFLEQLSTARPTPMTSRQRSSLRDELSMLRGIRKELAALREQKQIILTNVQKIKLARRLTAERMKADLKALREAKRLQDVQGAIQRKEYRAKILERRDSNPTSLTSTFVPFVLPTKLPAEGTLYTPSIGLSRALRRRQASQKKHNVTVPKVPASGKTLPEDHTYSVTKLRSMPKASASWTYQFDSLPSLESEQLAMTRSETDSYVVDNISDAENDQIAREERRARRRLERRSRKEGS